MEKYTELEMEIIRFDAEDVILTSPGIDGKIGNAFEDELYME